MRAYLILLLIFSLAMNVYMFADKAFNPPSYRIKTVSTINGRLLDLHDFETLNEGALSSTQQSYVIVPIRSGWMILVPQGKVCNETVIKIIESAQSRIDKVLETQTTSSHE
jgi:hypothetical protein